MRRATNTDSGGWIVQAASGAFAWLWLGGAPTRPCRRGMASGRAPAAARSPSRSHLTRSLLAWLLMGPVADAADLPFRLPTANQAIFETGGEARYFAPTVGKLWPSGTFGCVRTDGHQLHEGIDILRTRVDRRGEPLDDVMAVGDGVVTYINTRSGLSNYGIYVVIRHNLSGVTLYSLYAHLASVRPGVRAGERVKSGDVIATLGRTTNTRSSIARERAHLHLEFNFQINPRYAEWHVRNRAGERNDHGHWNGRNLVGVDPWHLYVEQRRLGNRFDWVRWIRGQPELCRVFVRAADFPWLRANPGLVRPNPRTLKEAIAGHEIALNYLGLPLECTPRAASEMKSLAENHVLYVNEAELSQHRCKRLVQRRGPVWEVTQAGTELLRLLTF